MTFDDYVFGSLILGLIGAILYLALRDNDDDFNDPWGYR